MTVSTVRTLVLDASLSVVPARWQSAAPELYWGAKDPGDTLDYSVSLAAWLADIGDTIASVAATVTPGSASVTAPTSSGGVVTTIVSGGVAGQRYGVAWSVTTAGGLTTELTVWLDCAARNAQPGQGAAGAGYQLPVAGTAQLGGVVVGANLSIDAGGTLSAITGGAVAIPAGTTADLLGASGTAGVAGLVALGANLTLANGTLAATGGVGQAGTLTIGTVTTGPAGGLAAASLVGTAPNQTLDLTIPVGLPGATGPQGPAGAVGPANTLSIGSVVSGPTAAASLVGAVPNQTLDLVLPQAAGSVTGVVAGAGLSGGTITTTGTVTLSAATTAALGGVIVGNGLAVSAGTLSNAGVLSLGTIVPASAAGSLLGTDGTLNSAVAISLGGGLALSGGTLSAGGGGLAVSGTYTASGTIAVTDTVALVNAAGAVAMTLAAGAADGHELVVKRYGAGAVTLTATIDGASATITMASGTVKEAVNLAWNAANSTWLLV